MKTMLKHPTAFLSVLITASVGIVAVVINAVLARWEVVVAVLVGECVYLAFYFASPYSTPLKYNDTVIRYQDAEYNWSEVKVTLVYTQERFNKIRYVYNLAFGESFMFGEDARNSVNDGFWVRLTINNLQIITQHYQGRIVVVGNDGSSIDVDKLLIDKRLKQMVNAHNSKYFDKLKETDGTDNEDL